MNLEKNWKADGIRVVFNENDNTYNAAVLHINVTKLSECLYRLESITPNGLEGFVLMSIQHKLLQILICIKYSYCNNCKS